MNRNQRGFSASIILVLIIVLSLIGFAGLNLLRNQKSTDKAKSNLSSNSLESEESLLITMSKLPAGWTVDYKDPSHVLLSNSTSECFVDTMYTDDTAESNSSYIDQNKQTVDAIKSKGYSVDESLGKLTISTASGKKQLDSQVLTVTGQDNPMTQEYAYITESNSYTRIQLSCPTASDIPTAKSVLLAIKFTKL